MDLKKIRERKHLTQEELAQKSGISIRTIQRIEAGQTPKGYTARALEKILEVDISSLNEVVSVSKEKNIVLIKLINLSSLFVLSIPFLNILVPLAIIYFYKEFNKITKQIISIQIFWTIAASLIFLLSIFIKSSFALSNSFTLWVMIILILINLVIILINTSSLDRNKDLSLKLNFQFF